MGICMLLRRKKNQKLIKTQKTFLKNAKWFKLSKLKTKAKTKTADIPDPENTFLWMCTLSESLMLLLQQQWHQQSCILHIYFNKRKHTWFCKLHRISDEIISQYKTNSIWKKSHFDINMCCWFHFMQVKLINILQLNLTCKTWNTQIWHNVFTCKVDIMYRKQ